LKDTSGSRIHLIQGYVDTSGSRIHPVQEYIQDADKSLKKKIYCVSHNNGSGTKCM
jgi:hypothetical protein